MKRAKKSQWSAPPPVTAGLLQRKCGCGGDSGLAGECKEFHDEKFKGATCADPLCESFGAHALAYESGPTEPVRFCVRQFLPQYLNEMPRTIIHEAVHLSGIDIDPAVKERYCEKLPCQTQCDDSTVADVWALFIDCLGGPYLKPKEAEAKEGAEGK